MAESQTMRSVAVADLHKQILDFCTPPFRSNFERFYILCNFRKIWQKIGWRPLVECWMRWCIENADWCSDLPERRAMLCTPPTASDTPSSHSPFSSCNSAKYTTKLYLLLTISNQSRNYSWFNHQPYQEIQANNWWLVELPYRFKPILLPKI